MAISIRPEQTPRPQSPPAEQPAAPASAPALSRLAEAAIAELGQRVIEIGCGAGHLTRRLLDREQVVALDPAREHVARVLSEFPTQTNLEAYSMEITSPRFRQLARFRPDSVLCIHGLERIEDDHRALFHMLSVLRPGGRVVVLAHACPWLFSPLDFALGHYRRYSADALRVTAEAVGLRVVRLDYVSFAGIASWWWHARLLGRTDRGPGVGTRLDRWIDPVLGRIGQWAQMPAGSGLFAVLERPGY
ncbi:MAG: methyltransferase domain-containing protein [Bryobacteraceae bacterium]